MTKMTDVVRNCRIETRLKLYEKRFDHEFSRRLLSICENTLLEQAAFDLLWSWKCTVNTAMLVWLTVHSVAKYHEAFTDANDPEILGGLDVFAANLVAEAKLSEEQVDVALDAVNAAKIHMRATRRDRAEFNIEDYWKQVIAVPEFQMAVWGSQRLVYSSLFHEYEHFLLSCLRITSGDKQLRSRHSTHLTELLETHFDSSTADTCWRDPNIQAARVVRNAFAHAGGRVTNEVSKTNHGITVEDDMLQVMPDDNVRLLNHLKKGVLHIAKKSV